MQKSYYLNELARSKTELIHALEQVSEKEFQKKLLPDSWTIAEILEHIVKVESAIIANLKKLLAEKSESLPEQNLSDEEVLTLSANTQIKVKAAPVFLPTGELKNKQTAIALFEKTRVSTEEFIAHVEDDFEVVAFPHARLGMLNGPNWLVFIAGHCLRHVEQMKNTLNRFP